MLVKPILLLALLVAGASAINTRTPSGKKTVMTKIQAHRGASAAAPENTIAAFKLAVDLGADAVELDTSLSADGVPVVMHDDTVDRTTDGTGKVSSLTLAQIRKLDAGSWKGEKYKGEPMPSLEDVFQMPKRPFLNIELKAGADTDRLAETVVKMIERYKAEKKVLISSFSPQALERVHEVNPKIPTAYLYSTVTPEKLPKGVTVLHPMYTRVDEGLMKLAREKGLQVNVWTIDDPAEMSRLISLGVNGIITNVPDVAKAVVAGK